jgi:adenine phosphoribosyltransferase
MNPTILTYRRLRESLESAPIVEKGDYDYLVHPLTDGVPRTDPALLAEAVEGLALQIEETLGARGEEADLILTAEAMGLPLAAGLAQRLGVPYVTARKRSYGLPGEIPLAQRTGYGEATLHLNDVGAGERVVIVDDLISTGGTLRALTHGLDEAGARLLHVAAVVTKNPLLDQLADELDCSVSALAAVEITSTGDRKRVRVTAMDVRS